MAYAPDIEVVRWPVHAFQGKEFEIILLIEPRALEVLEREIRPARQGEHIDRVTGCGAGGAIVAGGTLGSFCFGRPRGIYVPGLGIPSLYIM